MDEDNEVHIESYADRIKGRDIAEKGFRSLFKAQAKKDKIRLYLPLNGPSTKPQDWEKFYRDNRTGRTANERGSKIDSFALYHFLKKRPKDASSDVYYYAIPKGFTQTDLVNAEADYSYMIGKSLTIYDFRAEQRLSRKVGLCTLKRRS
jgi:hypothetical protein